MVEGGTLSDFGMGRMRFEDGPRENGWPLAGRLRLVGFCGRGFTVGGLG